MAEVTLFNSKIKHQHVCSTYRSRSKPTPQGKAAVRAANVAPFSNPAEVTFFNSKIKFNKIAKPNTMPTHHPKYKEVQYLHLTTVTNR